MSLKIRDSNQKIVILLRADPQGYTGFLRKLKWFNKLVQKKRVFFITDTDTLGDEYLKTMGIYPEVFPIILSSIDYAEPSPVPPVIFTYIGGASYNKGFDLLPEMISHIKDMLISGMIRLRIHCNLRMARKNIQDSMKRLEELESIFPGITLIKGPLGETEYVKLIHESNVLLILNRREFFAYHNSGPFVEAHFAGRPSIIARGTWMHKQNLEWGGSTAFESGDIRSLEDSIHRMVNNYEQFSAEAKKGAKPWKEFNNADTFVRKLQAL